MDGIPASVSAAIRTIFTNTLVDFAYSTIKIAAKTPIGTAIRSAKTARRSVLISAGSMDWFSVVHSHANSEGFRCGIPWISA